MLNMQESLFMYAFVLLFAGVGILITKKSKLNKYVKILLYIISAFPLFFIMAFRYDVGTDYFYGYIPAFGVIANGGDAFPREHGFYLLYKFLLMFTTNAQSIIILTSFIYVLFVTLLLINNSENPVVSVITLFLMTFFFIALNNIRQQIACIIVLWGFKFIKDKNFAAYLCTIVMAMYFFHQSVIGLLLAYPICNVKFFRKYAIIFAVVFLAILPFTGNVFEWFLELFGYSYQDNPSFEQNHGSRLLFGINGFILFLYFVFFNKDILKDRIVFVLFVAQFFATYMSFMTFLIHMREIPDRVAYLFMSFQVISMPMLYNKLKMGNKGVFVTTSLLMLSIMTYSFSKYIVINNYHETYPYQFVFSHWSELEFKKPETEKVNIINHDVSFDFYFGEVL